MNKTLKEIIANKSTCIFISPHLDDAVLSAGGLMAHLSKQTKVIVINVFTKSLDDKPSLSARKYVHALGYAKASTLYKKRREEDTKALASLGITPINLGFVEALWRKKEGIVAKTVGKILPDINYLYPTYRFHIAKGKIAKGDKITVKKLTNILREIVQKKRNTVVFCPLAVGNHVDHELVKIACADAFRSDLIYWSDFPYNIRTDIFGVPPKQYERVDFTPRMKEKKQLVERYKTQILGLFPKGIVPNHEEVFFIPKLKSI